MTGKRETTTRRSQIDGIVRGARRTVWKRLVSEANSTNAIFRAIKTSDSLRSLYNSVSHAHVTKQGEGKVGQSIAIVGAGAKAAAIAARAAILRDLGIEGVPTILAFEAEHVGAAWSGQSRFSSGYLTLCTPGEKDVGFPYAEIEPWVNTKAPIAPALFARFSWSAFLVATGMMVDWVDRGREHPTHRRWAKYLEWVFEQAEQEVRHAAVTGVRPSGSGWEVTFKQANSSNMIQVDGVVLTGAGRERAVQAASDIPAGRVLNSETFWAHRNTILDLDSGTIAVAGSGGAAGTIVGWLAEHFAEKDRVDILSIASAGTLFPRGDGYAERRWFSDPSDWSELSPQHRRNLIDRTEAGVVSMRIKSVIDRATNVGYRRGRATSVKWEGDELLIEMKYNDVPAPSVAAQYLISAIGFENWNLLRLVDDHRVRSLCDSSKIDFRRKVEDAICPDLTLPSKLGLPAGLHVPALAALAHGPGMGNLGCLGLMAEAVLKRYHK